MRPLALPQHSVDGRSDFAGHYQGWLPMNEHFWYVKRCSLFERLTQEQLARLEAHARVRRLPKNCAVYVPSEAADGVFLLGEGRIKLCSSTHEGKEAILAFIEPGEMFGELALVGESEREERAETVLPSTVVLLRRDVIETMMSESSDLALGVTKLIGLRRQRVERRLRSLLFRSNRDRLIHLLLELSEQYGRSTPEGILLEIRLSHQDLASVIGATRETVTVLLGELQLEGLLKVARQRIVIRRPDGLAAAADGSAEPSGISARPNVFRRGEVRPSATSQSRDGNRL